MSTYFCTRCSVEITSNEQPIHLCQNCGHWDFKLVVFRRTLGTPKSIKVRYKKNKPKNKPKNNLMREKILAALEK